MWETIRLGKNLVHANRHVGLTAARLRKHTRGKDLPDLKQDMEVSMFSLLAHMT
jgi:hypothetical protein